MFETYVQDGRILLVHNAGYSLEMKRKIKMVRIYDKILFDSSWKCYTVINR